MRRRRFASGGVAQQSELVLAPDEPPRTQPRAKKGTGVVRSPLALGHPAAFWLDRLKPAREAVPRLAYTGPIQRRLAAGTLTRSARLNPEE
jgi:hypothetical protein